MVRDSKEKPKVNIRFLYFHCNDLAAIREFYTNLIGMAETAYNEEWNYLNYKVEGLNFIFFGWDKELPVTTQFADQPGWQGGELPTPSLTVDIPIKDFPQTVKKLQNAGVSSFAGKPTWEQDSYWCFPVLDPMGNTVEVTTVPKEKPNSTEWSEE